MKELKKVGQSAGNSALKTATRRSASGRVQLSIAGSTGHAHTIAWTVAGRGRHMKVMHPLEKRKAGVLSGVTDS